MKRASGGKILIADRVHPILIEGIEKMGFSVDYKPAIDMGIFLRVIPHYVGAIINSKIRMTASVIDAGKRLRFIGRLGSGMEIIDIDHARQKGIEVINAPEGNRDAVAEHAIGMLLALQNHLLRADRQLRHLHWSREENRGSELKHKCLGIIGFGHTGSRLAKKMSSWELDIIAYDKYKEHFGNDFRYVEAVSLLELQQRADIVSLHVPLTEETRRMVDSAFLKRCKAGAILVNTSRGAVVDTLALIETLENGHLKGACIDVFENEKPATYTEEERVLYTRLGTFDQVILSPHIAGWTHESLERIARTLLEKIESIFAE